MSSDMAHDLVPYGVTVVWLYAGLVRTESVLEAGRAGWLDLSSESAQFIGLVIGALYRDPNQAAQRPGADCGARRALRDQRYQRPPPSWAGVGHSIGCLLATVDSRPSRR
jgi:hypothetical protein